MMKRFCLQTKKLNEKEIICYKRQDHSGPHTSQGLSADHIVITMTWYDPAPPAAPIVKTTLPPNPSPISFIPPTASGLKEDADRQRMNLIQARDGE